MLKLAPPIWTLLYLVLCVVLSWSLDWPTIPGLPLPPLGIGLVALAFIPPVWAGGPRSYAVIPKGRFRSGRQSQIHPSRYHFLCFGAGWRHICGHLVSFCERGGDGCGRVLNATNRSKRTLRSLLSHSGGQRPDSGVRQMNVTSRVSTKGDPQGFEGTVCIPRVRPDPK